MVVGKDCRYESISWDRPFRNPRADMGRSRDKRFTISKVAFYDTFISHIFWGNLGICDTSAILRRVESLTSNLLAMTCLYSKWDAQWSDRSPTLFISAQSAHLVPPFSLHNFMAKLRNTFARGTPE